jgi:hypothetical protein
MTWSIWGGTSWHASKDSDARSETPSVVSGHSYTGLASACVSDRRPPARRVDIG